jgi:hypothetical protein
MSQRQVAASTHLEQAALLVVTIVEENLDGCSQIIDLKYFVNIQK